MDKSKTYRTIDALARGETAALRQGKLALARLFRQSARELQMQVANEPGDGQRATA